MQNENKTKRTGKMCDSAEKLNDEYNDLLPCPFCLGDNLEGSVWHFAGGEINAIECKSCLASAPIVVWQNRDVMHECPNCHCSFEPNGSTVS